MNSKCRVAITDKNSCRWVNKKVDVEYNFEVEKRSWGIENITFSLSRIGIGKESGKGKADFESEDEEGYKDKEFEIDISKYSIIEDWHIADIYAIIDTGRGIEIDDREKEITVNLLYLSKGE